MQVSNRRFSKFSVVGGIVAVLGTLLVAGCGDKKPVVVALPPPPVAIAIPPRPYPPVWSSEELTWPSSTDWFAAITRLGSFFNPYKAETSPASDPRDAT